MSSALRKMKRSTERKISQHIDVDTKAIKEEIIKDIKNDITNEVRETIVAETTVFVIDAMLASFALALNDEYKFGQQRFLKVVHNVDERMEKVIDGTITVQDIKQQVLDRIGVDIKGGGCNLTGGNQDE